MAQKHPLAFLSRQLIVEAPGVAVPPIGNSLSLLSFSFVATLGKFPQLATGIPIGEAATNPASTGTPSATVLAL